MLCRRSGELFMLDEFVEAWLVKSWRNASRTSERLRSALCTLEKMGMAFFFNLFDILLTLKKNIANTLVISGTTMASLHTTTTRMRLTLLKMEASWGSRMSFHLTCALEAGDSSARPIMLISVSLASCLFSFNPFNPSMHKCFANLYYIFGSLATRIYISSTDASSSCCYSEKLMIF